MFTDDADEWDDDVYDDDTCDDDYDEAYDVDAYDDDVVETVACPSCGAEIYEDAERCPHCGDYVVPGQSHPWHGRGLIWLVLGAAGVIATIVALTF